MTASEDIVAHDHGKLPLVSAVAATLLVQCIISLLAAAIPVLTPAIAADRGWNATFVALYPALVLTTAFVISFRIPLLLARLGGMGLGLACIAVSAIGLLCVTSPMPALVVIAAITIGLAAGAMNPASSQVLGPRTPPHLTGFIMSLKQTGVPIGTALAGLLLPFFVFRFQWKLTAIGLAVAGGTIAIALVPVTRWLDSSVPRTPARHSPFEPVRRLWAMPGMPQFLLAGMAAGAAQYCLRSFYTVYLFNDVGLDLATAGFIFGISQASGIVGQIAWASLSDQALRPLTTIGLISLTIAGASVLSATTTHDWPFAGIVFTAVLFGVSAAGFIPVVLAEVARKAPEGQAGVLTSGANVFLFAAAAIGPVLFGGIAAYLSYPLAFAGLAAVTFIAGMVAITSRWRVG
jgi:MFS family permease